MYNTAQVILIVIQIAVLAVYCWHVNRFSLSGERVHKMLTRHYLDEGWKVLEVEKLSFTERLKHGVPLFWTHKLNRYNRAIFTGKIDYVRKVSLEGEDGAEFLKYIEFVYYGGDRFSVSEFESYDL